MREQSLLSYKYKKPHRVFLKSYKNNIPLLQKIVPIPSQKNYKFIALTNGLITYNQLESLRKIFVKKLHKSLYFQSFVSVNQIITAKPQEIRMGKGKGTFEIFSRVVSGGTPLFAISLTNFYRNIIFHHLLKVVSTRFNCSILLRP